MGITQEQIDNAIKNCEWRNDMNGIDICKGMIGVCSRIIDNRQCPTLIELFKENKS